MKSLTRFSLRKFVLGIGLLAIAGVVNQSYVQNNTSKFIGANQLRAGMSTCFNRLSQTFTALMMQDFGTIYASDEFMNTTSACFSEAVTLSTESNTLSSSIVKGINNISSQNFWFNEKVVKIKKIAAKGEMDLSQSNVIDKFSEIEALLITITDGLDDFAAKKASTIESAKVLGFAIWILLGLFSLAYYVANRLSAARLGQVEKAAKAMLESENELMSAKVDRFLEHSLNVAKIPETYNLFNRYHAQLLEKTVSIAKTADSDVAEAELPREVTVEGEVVDLNAAFNASLKMVQDLAFTHGVILDFQLDDDLYAMGNSDGIIQVIYNILSFSINSSLDHNTGRRVTVRARNLGEAVLLKTSIEHHHFEASELGFNGDEGQEDETELSLMMARELLSDYEGQIQLKNEDDAKAGSIEVVLQRAPEDKAKEAHELAQKVETLVESRNLVSLRKGTKKDILKDMENWV